MVDLSIVIVNWNTCALLRACLTSIFRHPPRACFEVIVVDNASSDPSPEMVRGEFPGVILKTNTANLGFAAANNLGSRLATGRFLLFLNSDTEVHASTLSEALSFMELHPETGVLGCRTLNPDGSLQNSACAFPTCLRIFAHVSGLSRFVKLPRRRLHERHRHPDYVQGSFLFVSKSVFAQCGGFNEIFFLYGEEVDLCLRLRALGLRIDYHPGIAITHHGGASSRNSPRRVDHFVTSCLFLYREHRSAAQVGRLRKTVKAALAVRRLMRFVSAALNFKKRGDAARALCGRPPAAADALPSACGKMSVPTDSVTILKTRIDKLGMDEVLERAAGMMSQSSPRHLITANVDQLVANYKGAAFRAIYRDAVLVLPDGVPLLWAARFLNRPLHERINGTDLMERICSLAARKGFRVFLLGGPEGMAARAAAALQKRYPGLLVAGTYFPRYGFEKMEQENEKICSLLRERKPSILFTSLGFPKGIQWIERHQGRCAVPLAIEVGASFSFISGQLKRAPRWMQARGLEWLWRLMLEPRRLWKRYLVRDMPFFLYLLRQKFSAD